jgi:O-6-methylguanine DNA methyltransferase
MTETVFQSTLSTPIGALGLSSTPRGLLAVALGRGGEAWVRAWLDRLLPGAEARPAAGEHAVYSRQILEYFHDGRRVFDIPLDVRGTAFQKRVWAEVARIPYGRTATYSMLAVLVDRPGASRAVGAANGANPLPVVIPCHRVLGADGSLTGYGGGLPLKRWLLVHEGVLPKEALQMRLFRGEVRAFPG